MAKTHKEIQGIDGKGQSGAWSNRANPGVKLKTPANKNTADLKSDKSLSGKNMGPSGLNK